jgi:hypothetical protein
LKPVKLCFAMMSKTEHYLLPLMGCLDRPQRSRTPPRTAGDRINRRCLPKRRLHLKMSRGTASITTWNSAGIGLELLLNHPPTSQGRPHSINVVKVVNNLRTHKYIRFNLLKLVMNMVSNGGVALVFGALLD